MKHFQYLDFFNTVAHEADNEGAGGSDDTGTEDKGTNDKGTDNNDDPVAKLKAELQAEFEAKLKKVESEYAGLKNKNQELLSKNADLKKTALSDEDYKKYAEFQERLARDQLLKLMSEGKSEEALEIATKRVRLEHEAKIALEVEEKNKAVAMATAAQTELTKTLISASVAREIAAKVEPQYISLVEKLTDGNYKVVDGNVRVVDEAGNVKMGTNGQPLSISDHVESLRTQYAALFKTSAGGGAGGSANKKIAGAGKLDPETVASLSQEEYIKARKENRI